jgi:hypothetical protein
MRSIPHDGAATRLGVDAQTAAELRQFSSRFLRAMIQILCAQRRDAITCYRFLI